MFCFKCGAELPEGTLVCTACNARQPHAFKAKGSDVYGGVFRRAVAFVIDRVLVMLTSFIVVLLTGADTKNESEAAAVVGVLVVVLVWLLYAPLMEASRVQATLGKLVMDLKVVDAEGQRVGFLRAMGRHLMAFFSSFFFIGYLMAAFTDRRQTLHDMASGCLVVRRESTPDEAMNASPATRDAGAIIVVVVLLGAVPVIGILAAVAIPAYQDYTSKAKIAEAYQQARAASVKVGEFYAQNQRVPATVEEAGFTHSSKFISDMFLDERGVIRTVVTLIPPSEKFAGKQAVIVLIPSEGAQGVEWRCRGESVGQNLFPAACRDKPIP